MIRGTLASDVRGAQHTAFDALARVGNEDAGAFRTLAESASSSSYVVILHSCTCFIVFVRRFFPVLVSLDSSQSGSCVFCLFGFTSLGLILQTPIG